MEYSQVTIRTGNEEQREILIALLENAGYEGFEEREDAIAAFIPASDFAEDTLNEIVKPMDLTYSLEAIAQQNWNKSWESNFEPVIIEGICPIRASFHDIEVSTPYEIVITPKMSFGTGHHATTRLMVQTMAGMDLVGKRVLDFGTGTGILAIMAEMKGAAEILAIDNDEWSFDNTKENIGANDCRKIEVKQGSLEVTESAYDMILANINRHILLQYMEAMYAKLKEDGTLLLSGLLTDDRNIINEAAVDVGFRYENGSEYNNWISLVYKK